MPSCSPDIADRVSDPPADGRLVVIGASAGGLDAMSALLARLPANYPIPIVYVTHLSSQYSSYLSDVLDWTTGLDVVPVSDGAKLCPGRVYVSVPGRNVRITAAGIRLETADDKERFCPSIDIALRSAAAEFGDRMIAVLLTGRLDDGVEGLIKVYQNGGMTIVQDPTTAEHPSMPSEAVIRDHPDFVEPLDKIADRLLSLAGCRSQVTA